jgi:hypothetical protein
MPSEYPVKSVSSENAAFWVVWSVCVVQSSRKVWSTSPKPEPPRARQSELPLLE